MKIKAESRSQNPEVRIQKSESNRVFYTKSGFKNRFIQADWKSRLHKLSSLTRTNQGKRGNKTGFGITLHDVIKAAAINPQHTIVSGLEAIPTDIELDSLAKDNE